MSIAWQIIIIICGTVAADFGAHAVVSPAPVPCAQATATATPEPGPTPGLMETVTP